MGRSYSYRRHLSGLSGQPQVDVHGDVTRICSEAYLLAFEILRFPFRFGAAPPIPLWSHHLLSPAIICVTVRIMLEHQTVSRHQHRLPVGSVTGKGLRTWRMGHVTTNGRNAGHRSGRAKRLPRLCFGNSPTPPPKPRRTVRSRPVNTGSRLLFTRGYSVFNASQVDGPHHVPKEQ